MNIIIIGDIMIDINNNSEVKRNAPEANIPIYNILDVNYILGGAANVAKNLKNLETNVEIISVVGNDLYGNIIRDIFCLNDINNKLFVDNNRKTTQKNRIFTNNTLNVRFDIEDTYDISVDIESQIIDYVTIKNDIDAIIISDYDKGVVTERLCQTIINYANKNNIPIFVDPKLKNYIKYKGCFLFKPNIHEAETITNEKNIEKILNTIFDNIQCQNILITKGKDGMILNNLSNSINHTEKFDLVDVTGAGDIVLAVLVYYYLKYKNLWEACKISNYIGGKSVQNIGNYSISLKDIKDYEYKNNVLNKKIIYDFEIDKIKSLSEKKGLVFTNGCFDILHSAHIQLLQYSKKQGNILVVGLNSDDSIKRLKGSQRPINDIHERSKILTLFDFIDYIIIFSEDTPLNIIKMLEPNILVKGSDYKIDNIIGKEYVDKIILFDYINGKSSTNVINKIKNI